MFAQRATRHIMNTLRCAYRHMQLPNKDRSSCISDVQGLFLTARQSRVLIALSHRHRVKSTLPHQYNTTSIQYHINTIPHQYITTSIQYHINTIPHRYNTTSKQYHINKIPHQYNSTSIQYHINTLPHQYKVCEEHTILWISHHCVCLMREMNAVVASLPL